MLIGADGTVTVAAVAAGLAAAWTVAAAREGLSAWPAARAWLEGSLAPIGRAGSEGYEPTYAERRRVWIVGSIVAGSALIIIFGFGVYLAALGAVPMIIDRVIAARRRRFEAAFEAGLGSWARSLADALASGFGVRTALVETIPPAPAVAAELARVRAELEAGVGLEPALERLGRRVESPGGVAIAAALRVAARSGGEVSSLLRRFAIANDERVAALADARAATAQARMTGIAVAAMPVAGLLFAELASPGFVAALLGDGLARTLLVVSVLIQLAAFALIRQIARVGG